MQGQLIVFIVLGGPGCSSVLCFVDGAYRISARELSFAASHRPAGRGVREVDVPDCVGDPGRLLFPGLSSVGGVDDLRPGRPSRLGVDELDAVVVGRRRGVLWVPVVAPVAGAHDRVEGADGPAVLGVDEVHVHEQLVDVGVLGVPSASGHLLERDAVAAPDLPWKDSHARVVFVFSRRCGGGDGLLHVSAGRYPTGEA